LATFSGCPLFSLNTWLYSPVVLCFSWSLDSHFMVSITIDCQTWFCIYLSMLSVFHCPIGYEGLYSTLFTTSVMAWDDLVVMGGLSYKPPCLLQLGF
jgi:hypothetical protein